MKRSILVSLLGVALAGNTNTTAVVQNQPVNATSQASAQKPTLKASDLHALPLAPVNASSSSLHPVPSLNAIDDKALDEEIEREVEKEKAEMTAELEKQYGVTNLTSFVQSLHTSTCPAERKVAQALMEVAKPLFNQNYKQSMMQVSVPNNNSTHSTAQVKNKNDPAGTTTTEEFTTESTTTESTTTESVITESSST